MPIYEYSCKQCGEFEVTQRISEDPLKKCPTCGTKVTKLISPSAFHLKGSGWYMTDYAKNGASSKSSSSESKTSEDSKDSTSTSAASASAKTGSSSSSRESSTSA